MAKATKLIDRALKSGKFVNGLWLGHVSFDVIEELFTTVLDCQRSHEDRVLKATYLHGDLFGDQLTFHAVRFDGDILLADGYTRCQAILQKLTTRPESVGLVVHDVATEDERKKLYDQFNSPMAAKKSGDRVQEAFRWLGVRGNIISHLVLKGPLATGAVHATGKTAVREAVIEAYPGIQFLDDLGLHKFNTTGGLMAGYVCIGIAAAAGVVDAEVAEDFIRKVNQVSFRSTKAEDAPIVVVHDKHDKHRDNQSTSGTKNVNTIRDLVLTEFAKYVSLRMTPEQKMKAAQVPEAVNPGNFTSLMKKLAA